ncbi:MAG: AI-2E family transporter [Eubacteriales bacterium]|nr:AI-2E family transporter [Eubacteriales bacterium]
MKWNIERKYIRVGLIALGVIVLAILFNYSLQNNKEMANVKATIQGTLSPIVMGCILAYLLTPFLHFFEDYCFLPLGRLLFKSEQTLAKRKNFARGMSILCTMLLLLVVVVGGLYLVIPQVYQSLSKIVTDAPTYYDEVQKWVESLNPEKSEISRYLLLGVDQVYTQALNYLNKSILPNMDKIVAGITSGIMGGLKILLNVVLSLIISIYVMAGKENLISVAKKMIYSIFSIEHANTILDGMRYAGKVFGGFVNGKIIDSFIIGGICYVFMVIVGFEYAVLISIVIGVTNIIPYFGPFIGGIPSVLILLMVNPKQGIIFAIFVLILQQVDGNIIGPIVLGDRLKLSSMWILLSILIGGGFFGVIGMILGAPCFACLYTFISTISKRKLDKKNLPTETDVYYDIERIVKEDGACVVIQNKTRRIEEKKVPEEAPKQND